MTDRQRYGYYLLPSSYDPPLGFGGLDVYLAEPDPERYFDAATALFTVVEEDYTDQIEIGHPFSQASQRYRVGFGRYYLLAHNGDLVEGLCLGGELHVEQHPNYTHCHLSSPAPLFDIEEDGGLVADLDVEIEAELARLRAEWPHGDDAFDRRLASLDPMTLLAASLNLLEGYLHEHLLAAAPDDVLSERSAVHRAIHTLRRAGQWPEPTPTLRQLMLHA